MPFVHTASLNLYDEGGIGNITFSYNLGQIDLWPHWTAMAWQPNSEKLFTWAQEALCMVSQPGNLSVPPCRGQGGRLGKGFVEIWCFVWRFDYGTFTKLQFVTWKCKYGLLIHEVSSMFVGSCWEFCLHCVWHCDCFQQKTVLKEYSRHLAYLMLNA